MIFTRGLKVCLAAQPADLRRSFEGLALLVRGALKEDERSTRIFVSRISAGTASGSVPKHWDLAPSWWSRPACRWALSARGITELK